MGPTFLRAVGWRDFCRRTDSSMIAVTRRIRIVEIESKRLFGAVHEATLQVMACVTSGTPQCGRASPEPNGLCGCNPSNEPRKSRARTEIPLALGSKLVSDSCLNAV